MRMPPVLSASPATEQAVQDLIGVSRQLGQFIAELPPSPERDRAAVMFNEAILWAHQGLMRASGGTALVLADRLPS